ncbi:protein CHROMATIN REMODELING 20 isoform X2 [Phoenix dactylifera]|uniref:ATP-dependent helicase ATRX n=1 Tax=Phoenix dactylifera TaxID=42345 RepID=A0A8B7CWL3_PHODC|nr:protein CHROMATIN REMODELING 20 isoform X2 [Phoenix dactylifera]
MEGPGTEQQQLNKMEVIVLEEQQEQEVGMTKEGREDELIEVEGHKRGRDVHMKEPKKEHEVKNNEEHKKEHEEEKKDIEMEEPWNSDEDVGSDSYEMFVDDLDSEQASTFDNDDESNSEVPLTDAEVEELIAEFLEVESKAAEAQESLEKESLARVESEVRVELAENLLGDALEMAVSTEMQTFREEWEAVLDDLETQSSLLLEQLDGAGIELPSLYRWIESQVPNGCCTEAWKKRAQWVGTQVTIEVNESVREAEEYLKSCRPVRRQHGRLLEEGASGFLERTLSIKEKDNLAENSEKDWSKFDELIQSHGCTESTSFGSKNWAYVYRASTPQQAAQLGLQLPGVDEVEEIGEIEGNINDPLYADAIANEKEIELSEEQRRKYRKVREEDDVHVTRKLQHHLKRRRNRNSRESIEKEVPDGFSLSNECPQPVSEKPSSSENGVANVDNTDIFIHDLESQAVISNGSKNEKLMFNGTWKRSRENEDAAIDNKRSRTVIIDSDDEVQELNSKSASHAPSKEQDSPLHVKKEVDIIDVDGLPSPCPKDISRNFRCTACSNVLKASEVHRHPLLDVIICGNCKFLVVEKTRLEDSVLGGYCRWCGKGDDVINCNSCKILFCGACIARNFGEERLSEAKTSGWQCCCCSPTLLHGFILDCEKAIGGLVVSSSGSDSELSNAQMDVTIRKRQKKKIRRILDDAELGEETKLKIAMEKARQEHLKSMQAQSAGKLCRKSPAYVNGDATEVAMGDADEGFIVNVAREKDEELVRIPRSISAKLKPHQVTGIRFMWENIIQSVKKVRSGDKGFGCILAHTMGLGKTFQVIAFLYTAMRTADLGLKTALVVTPVNVLHNWRQEFVKWKPVERKPLRVYMLEDVTREKRAYLLSKWRIKGGVLLIGYAAFRNLSLGRHVKDRHMASEICNALHYGPDILVCDEAHMIKNTRADITHALKQVKTQRRIALTGSPLQNNLMEYYCMVDFVREGYLGSSQEFRNRFQNPIENGQHTNSTLDDVKTMNQRSHILYEQLKGFVQRMDMNVVKNDLPPKTVYVITVKLSPLQRKLYKKFLDVHGFASDKVSSEKTIRRSCFFAGYQALAQIWNHPGLLQMAKEHRDSLRREDAVENFLVDDSSSDDNMETDLTNGEKQRMKNDSLNKKSDTIFYHEESDWWEHLLDEKIYREVDYSGKMVLLLDILSMSSEFGDKALVFSQSLTTLDLIELFLSKLPRKGREGKYWKQGKDWYRLDGSTQCSERQKLVERFNEPTNTRVKCTLISTRAGSLGINLHAANRVIVVDGSWNPTYDLQAIYRVWRYGQNKPVYAYRLMAHGTMEEKIYKRQVTKEGLAARVVDRQQIHRTMSKEEILHLFDFGEDENSDMLEQKQENQVLPNKDTSGEIGCSWGQKSLPLCHGASCTDKIMESIFSRHYPRWIANYHEHETLLQENEAERLSKEEQDIAWQTYQRSLEWEEVHRTVFDDSERKLVADDPVKKKLVADDALPESSVPQQTKGSSRSRSVNQRKCTNLAHLLTLRSQGTKSGCSTICGECAQEISWENLNRDGKSR